MSVTPKMKCPVQKKVCYKKETRAWLAAERMIVKGLVKETPNVYRCPFCKYFHWTRLPGEMPPKEKQRLERMRIIKEKFYI